MRHDASMTVLDHTAALARLHALLRTHHRVMLGLTGPPAAGKSTLAQALQQAAEATGVTAAVVPMDGFHLAQSVLEARGLAAVKGAAETFDAYGYLALLQRIRQAQEPVWAPTFDRSLEDAIAGSIEVTPDVRLVITEGNYLLDGAEPWARVRAELDECWYVEVPDGTRLDRLVARHEQHGRTSAAARERATGSDERNAERVRQARGRANTVVEGPVGPTE